LIVSGSGILALVLKSLTATIPIITASSDPVVAGPATSLGRAGGNITEVSVDPGFEVWSKRLQLLSETVSNRLTNVRVLAAATLQWWDAAGGAVREAAQRTGVAITGAFFGDGIIDHAAYERVSDAMKRDRVDGLMMRLNTSPIVSKSLILAPDIVCPPSIHFVSLSRWVACCLTALTVRN
jgi:hypothetical protein